MYLPGRVQPVRIIKSERPEEIHPETWMRFTKPEMARLKAEWEVKRPLRDAARRARGLTVPIPLDRTSEYLDLVKKVQEDLNGAQAPCMPLQQVFNARLKHLAAAANEVAHASGQPMLLSLIHI